MKKRIILSLILVPILLIGLVLTGCGKTSGEGVFIWEEEVESNELEPYYIDHYITFEVQAQPDGNAYHVPISDESLYEYLHYQPADGKIEFLDTLNGMKFECMVDGTFYIKPKDYKEFFSEIPEDSLISAYFGPCEVKEGDDKAEFFLLALFIDYTGELTYPYFADQVEFFLFEEDIFEDGVISFDAEPIMEHGGFVVEGNIAIE